MHYIYINKILLIDWWWNQVLICYTSFFHKQPVHKQLAFEWQIAKQLLGLNPLSPNNNKNYILKKNGVFPLQ